MICIEEICPFELNEFCLYAILIRLFLRDRIDLFKKKRNGHAHTLKGLFKFF